MRSYLSLVPISARARRRENRMTIVCILFAVLLVAAIFSVADMMIRQETNRLIAKHGAAEMQSFLERPGVTTLYPVAAVLFLLVLLAGVLMISGSMSSSVSRRIPFFGMMRCIGMSQAQIKRLVRYEALNLCTLAIPLGLLGGTAVSWLICAALKYAVGGEWSDIPQLGISFMGLVSGTLVGFFSVLLAAGKPARKACSVSPAAAVSGRTQIPNQTVPMSAGRHVELGLGLRHALESKRGLILRAGSIAFSIVLFLCFCVLLRLVNCLIPQGADIEIMAKDAANTLPETAVSEILKMDCVKQAEPRRSSIDIPISCGTNPSVQTADIISMEEAGLTELQRTGFLDKRIDLSPLFETTNHALLITDRPVKAGTEIQMNGKSLFVIGCLSYDPFSTDGIIAPQMTLLTSNETFAETMGVRDYSYLALHLTRNAQEGQVEKIRALVGTDCSFSDLRSEDATGTYWAFVICVYGFLIVIAAVSLLNIINSISMGVQARLKLYGAMRAVGMNQAQLVRMIGAEAAAYGFVGALAGLAIGLSLSGWMFRYLITSHFAYAHWSFPFGQVFICILFVAVSVCLGIVIPTKKLKTLSVTETLRAM